MMLNNKDKYNGGSVVALLRHFLKLEAIDKLTIVTTYLIVIAVIFALATSAIFFLSTGLVKSLSAAIGDEALAYYIVGGMLVLCIIVFYMNRKAWVETPVVKSISSSILNNEAIDEDREDII